MQLNLIYKKGTSPESVANDYEAVLSVLDFLKISKIITVDSVIKNDVYNKIEFYYNNEFSLSESVKKMKPFLSIFKNLC